LLGLLFTKTLNNYFILKI